MERIIFHCDLNNFYASVECLHHPEYRNVPLAVGGDIEKRQHRRPRKADIFIRKAPDLFDDVDQEQDRAKDRGDDDEHAQEPPRDIGRKDHAAPPVPVADASVDPPGFWPPHCGGQGRRGLAASHSAAAQIAAPTSGGR